MGEIADRLVEKRVQEAIEKSVHECKVDIAKKLIINGMLIMGVAECTELPLEEVKELWDQIEEEMSAREAAHECSAETAKRILADGVLADGTMTLEKIAKYSGLSVEEVKRLAKESVDSHSM